MTISTLSQKIGITAVEGTVVTEKELDPVTGLYVREIRVLGADDAVLFTLQISSASEAKINVTAPEQEF